MINVESPVEFSGFNMLHKQVFLDIRKCLNELYKDVSIDEAVTYIPLEDELVVVFFAPAKCWCRGRVRQFHVLIFNRRSTF